MNFPSSVRKITTIASTLAFLTLLVGHKPEASGQTNRDLEITVRLDANAHDQAELPKFRLELRNVGARDLVLDLGFTLSNGSKQYPRAFVLLITDPQGKTRQFDLVGPGAIAGRVDPLILPLPIGSTFSVPIDLKKYWAGESKEFDYKFQRGTYSIQGRFTGRAVSQQEANLDVKGIALMPYWTGTVVSNQLPFDVGK